MHRVAVWTHDASGCSLDAWVAACHAYGCRRGLCSLLATHLPGRSPDECGDRLESLHVQMSAGAAARGSVCFCGTGRHLDGSRIPFDGSWVQCDGCQLWCHRQCTGLKPTKAACDDVECACPACTLLLTTYYLLLTPHYLLLTTWSYSLFTTHYSLLTTHVSLTTHHLLLLTTQVRMPLLQRVRGERDEEVPPQHDTGGRQRGGPLRHAWLRAARPPPGEECVVRSA
jgi:hypothetical protein